ncbi:hypothetical protein L9F63_008906, partial [Diploptera punctata]
FVSIFFLQFKRAYITHIKKSTGINLKIKIIIYYSRLINILKLNILWTYCIFLNCGYDVNISLSSSWAEFLRSNSLFDKRQFLYQLSHIQSFYKLNYSYVL